MPNIDSPVFMIGMPRSGTTVISEAMALHEQFGWISNLQNRKPAWGFLSLLNRLTDTPLADIKALRAKKKQADRAGGSNRFRLPYGVEAIEYWERLFGEKFSWEYLLNDDPDPETALKARGAVKTLLEMHGKERLFAKFTGPPRIRFLRKVFPQAKFVHVVRDPRAVAASLMDVDFWRGKGGFDGPFWRNGLPEESISLWKEHGGGVAALAAVQWSFIVQLAGREAAEHAPGALVDVRFEDMVDDPHGEIIRAFEELGLPDSPTAHRYLEGLGKLRNMNYKYKERLSAEDIAQVEAVTRETAEKYGYVFE